MTQEYFSVTQLADCLGYHPNTIRNIIAEARSEGIELLIGKGKRGRIEKDQFMNYLRGGYKCS